MAGQAFWMLAGPVERSAPLGAAFPHVFFTILQLSLLFRE